VLYNIPGKISNTDYHVLRLFVRCSIEG